MERRKYTRITVDIPATFSMLHLEGFHTGMIANISKGGFFFPFDEKLPVGEQCGVTVVIGEGLKAEHFYLGGTIVRSDEDGVGVRFHNGGEAQQEAVKRIIDYYGSPSQPL